MGLPTLPQEEEVPSVQNPSGISLGKDNAHILSRNGGRDQNPDSTGSFAVEQPHKPGHSNGYDRDTDAGRMDEKQRGSATPSVTDDEGDSSSQHTSDGPGEASPQAHTVPPLTRLSTNVSLGPDNPVEHYTSFVDVPDSVYEKLPRHRKIVIVALLSYCAFLAPISSTTVLSATPEVAAEYHTTGAIIDLSNALYMLFMGISPILWGPFSEVWGRRTITCTTALLFFCCSIGTALAPNLAAFFVFRILTAFEGTAFLLVGSACLQDIFHPTKRATAMGWFLSGTLVGPAFGPVVGGIIVTYTSWRVIFWVQVGLSGVAVLGTFFLLPETIHHKKCDDLGGLSKRRKAAVLWYMVNPWRILRLMVTYPNLILAGVAASALTWNMYSLLTPIRYVLNPRFHLTTPMQSGLFYLAPGAGYLLGTFFGGRYADHVVKKYMAKTPGAKAIPEDRLRSALPFMGIVIPACVLVYGWCVEKNVGGIPLVVVVLFLQGVAQLFCFPSLNTYCLDVMPGHGSDVIAGNYFSRYLCAAMGTGVVLPAVESIGVGWFSTISALFLTCSALSTWAMVLWGKGWREKVDRKRRARAARRRERAREKNAAGEGSNDEGVSGSETAVHGEEGLAGQHVDSEKEEEDTVVPTSAEGSRVSCSPPESESMATREKADGQV